jgi:hypothetical protein
VHEVNGADAYVQQRGGGDFMGLTWAWPGLMAWYVPAAMSGQHLLTAVEDVLQVVVMLPPFIFNPPTSFDSQVTRPATRARVHGCRGGGPRR